MFANALLTPLAACILHTCAADDLHIKITLKKGGVLQTSSVHNFTLSSSEFETANSIKGGIKAVCWIIGWADFSKYFERILDLEAPILPQASWEIEFRSTDDTARAEIYKIEPNAYLRTCNKQKDIKKTDLGEFFYATDFNKKDVQWWRIGTEETKERVVFFEANFSDE